MNNWFIKNKQRAIALLIILSIILFGAYGYFVLKSGSSFDDQTKINTQWNYKVESFPKSWLILKYADTSIDYFDKDEYIFVHTSLLDNTAKELFKLPHDHDLAILFESPLVLINDKNNIKIWYIGDGFANLVFESDLKENEIVSVFWTNLAKGGNLAYYITEELTNQGAIDSETFQEVKNQVVHLIYLKDSDNGKFKEKVVTIPIKNPDPIVELRPLGDGKFIALFGDYFSGQYVGVLTDSGNIIAKTTCLGYEVDSLSHLSFIMGVNQLVETKGDTCKPHTPGIYVFDYLKPDKIKESKIAGYDQGKIVYSIEVLGNQGFVSFERRGNNIDDYSYAFYVDNHPVITLKEFGGVSIGDVKILEYKDAEDNRAFIYRVDDNTIVEIQKRTVIRPELGN